jgi:hypothetical protein
MLSEVWRTSTRSGEGGNCVKVRQHGDRIEVRDSKQAAGPVLSFSVDEWTAFLGGAHDGEFDPFNGCPIA